MAGLLAPLFLMAACLFTVQCAARSGLTDVDYEEYECETDDNCAKDEVCVGSYCVDPCKDRCGTNAECLIHEHIPNCACKPGYTGNALNNCVRVECETHNQCPANKACVESKCVDPCQGRCASNADCLVREHVPTCACKPGYTGNALNNCVRVECETHNQCPANKACVESKCVDPCQGRCASNADCLVREHVPQCTCKAGYKGNALDNCVRVECETNNQCPANKACVESKCVDPCQGRCASNADCLVREHVPQCTCKAGYKGNALDNCVRLECETNNQCPANKACVESKCVDPCQGRCASNADCLVREHVPTCACKPGYTGNALNNCVRVECETHNQCPANKACVESKCVDPCQGRCASNADCLVREHVPTCACKAGYTGNALNNCVRLECETHNQCPANKACVNSKCLDPCQGRCASNADCLVREHVPTCACKAGYKGNALNNCVRLECETHNQCPANKACVNSKCLDPCQGRCASNADCLVREHVPTCACKSGYTGNALSHCSVKQEPPKQVAREPAEQTLNQKLALCKELFAKYTKEECVKCCENVKKIEEQYKESDHIMDEEVDRLIININGENDDDSDSTDWDSSDSD